MANDNALQNQLSALLNSHSADNSANTPDYILASYLRACLNAFTVAVQQRDTHEGRDGRPSAPTFHELNGPPPSSGIEALAEYAHAAWSGWMKYMFDHCQFLPSTEGGTGALIPASKVDRWQRQMNTPYADLPESEKASDRAEAQKILEALRVAPEVRYAECTKCHQVKIVCCDNGYRESTGTHINPFCPDCCNKKKH